MILSDMVGRRVILFLFLFELIKFGFLTQQSVAYLSDFVV